MVKHRASSSVSGESVIAQTTGVVYQVVSLVYEDL